jgi:hypothetical protein
MSETFGIEEDNAKWNGLFDRAAEGGMQRVSLTSPYFLLLLFSHFSKLQQITFLTVTHILLLLMEK